MAFKAPSRNLKGSKIALMRGRQDLVFQRLLGKRNGGKEGKEDKQKPYQALQCSITSKSQVSSNCGKWTIHNSQVVAKAAQVHCLEYTDLSDAMILK